MHVKKACKNNVENNYIYPKWNISARPVHQLFAILLYCIMYKHIYAFEVPFSNNSVITNENMLTGLRRTSPDDQSDEKKHTKLWVWYDDTALKVLVETPIDSTFCKGLVAEDDTNCDEDYIRLQLQTVASNFAYVFIAYPQGNIIDGILNSALEVS